jgi:hypothetical protein
VSFDRSFFQTSTIASFQLFLFAQLLIAFTTRAFCRPVRMRNALVCEAGRCLAAGTSLSSSAHAVRPRFEHRKRDFGTPTQDFCLLLFGLCLGSSKVFGLSFDHAWKSNLSTKSVRFHLLCVLSTHHPDSFDLLYGASLFVHLVNLTSCSFHFHHSARSFRYLIL